MGTETAAHAACTSCMSRHMNRIGNRISEGSIISGSSRISGGKTAIGMNPLLKFMPESSEASHRNGTHV